MRTISGILAFSFILIAGLSGCSGTRSASLQTNGEAVTSIPPEQLDSSVVAVYDDQVVTIEEFEDQYSRSAGGTGMVSGDTLSNYREFLSRYIDFRLKVLAARASGLDRDEAIQQELDTYRTNLARPLLLEKEVIEPLMRELFERMQTARDVSHILIRIPDNPSPEDTLAAYNRLAAIRDSVVQGAEFGSMALRHSDDPSARMTGRQGYEGRLGFFSAGMMVREFEDFAYTTPVGDVSPVFRTQFGYHFLKVHDQKPSEPAVRVSHIMITPEGIDSTAARNARAKLGEIQERLAAGEDFSDLARTFSNHPPSAERGGDVGWLSPYRLDAAPDWGMTPFELKEIGDVSGIVRSQYGFHLIKLTARQSLNDYEMIKGEIRTYVSRLPEAREAQTRLAQRIRNEEGSEFDAGAVMKALDGIAPDSILVYLAQADLDEASTSTTFARLGERTFTVKDLAEYVKVYRPRMSGLDRPELINRLSEVFLDHEAIEFAAQTLEDRDPEFRRTMEEFHDGLLLFRVMEDSVWKAASQDTLALEALYAANHAKYRFQDRVRVLAFNHGTDSVLIRIGERIKQGTPLSEISAEILADTLLHVRLDTVMVAEPTGSVFDRVLQMKEGELTETFDQPRGHIMLYHAGIDPAREKTFAEARAEVINDHQQALEDAMLRRLRAQYNVRLFPDRLSQAFKHGQETSVSTSSL